MTKDRVLKAASAIALALAGVPVLASQQPAPAPSQQPQACGVDNTDFNMKRDGVRAGTAAPPANRALVYVIELMPREGLTTHVKLGMDGIWLAQLSGQTFLSFPVDAGIHHLCARYEGHLAASELGATILHRLDAEAGKTYYLLYRGFITKDAGEVGFFDLVDEDEGRYALQTTEHLVSTVRR